MLFRSPRHRHPAGGGQVPAAQAGQHRQPRQPLLPGPVLGAGAAKQTEDAELAEAFGPLAAKFTEGEQKIAEELLAVQGSPADIGGYYRPDPEKTASVMRPSATFNAILDEIAQAL